MARLVNMPDYRCDNLESSSPDNWNDAGIQEDALIEEILTNITSTPLGQVLKRMASLPEIRKGKVLRLRQQITDGSYDEDDRLEAALDRVLEDLTA